MVKNKRKWINLSIINLTIVALIGMILRSKIVFSLPFIDYNRLLEAHEHFAFGAWVTLALMILMVYELLPETLYTKKIYQWILAGIALNSWIMLFTFILSGNSFFSNIFSTLFIFITYVFSWVFINDLRKTAVNKTVFLLAVASVVCLVVSSVGPFAMAYLFASKSLNAIFYKDALYTYLHFQYNGFFSLAVFALLFHKLESKISIEVKKNIHWFSVLLVISILPSQFLTYLWQGPNNLFRTIAIMGSITLLLSLIWFIISAFAISKSIKTLSPIVKYLGVLSMIAFMLKTFLQSFTIFPAVGNAVFGDRPIIIGFLHLVFLGFVSVFLLTYFAQVGLLNVKKKIIRVVLVVFMLAVIFNEATLMLQGLGAIFIKSSHLFPLLLWVASIWLFVGAILITAESLRFKSSSANQ